MNIELTNKDVDMLLKALSALSDYMQMSYSNQERFRKEHNRIAKISNKIFHQVGDMDSDILFKYDEMREDL